MKLYNTLSKTVEEFQPITSGHVGMYTCGITAYDYAHIGHGRKYVGDDILRRTLSFMGYTVTHVQNITDVGHLSSDSDEGEDKLEKGAAKTGKTVWDVAKFFAEDFYKSMDLLHILRPTTICRATDHIPEQIQLIETLLRKGHAYDTQEAVYFDVTTFPEYGKLFGQALEEKQTAVREEVKTGDQKKHAADFALWFKRVGRFTDHAMHWDSPWGDGFPGWHIECSAMSMKYLGETIDIHTGGIDHIPVHHPNEIAQSEGATGKPFVRYWIHHAHLMVENQKMSKSLGNIYRIQDVTDKGFDPLALRYFYLQAVYRKPLNFTWEALKAAQNALDDLRKYARSIENQSNSQERTELSPEKLAKTAYLKDAFTQALANDLNTPQALAITWETVKSNIPSQDKLDLLQLFDQVLGIDLFIQKTTATAPIPAHIIELADTREKLRSAKQYTEADLVRKQIEEAGYTITDASGQSVIQKKLSF